MYNTGKRTSLKVVLEKVLRDYDGVITEIQWADAIEWAAEAINLLGLSSSYEDKISKEISIVNGRGELPCDISYIKMVRDFNSGTTLVRSFDQFHLSNYYRCSEEQVSNCSDCNDIPTYTTNNNYIFTSFTEGSIEISYKGIPTDEWNVPTIPDTTKYIRAIATYIAERVCFKLTLQNKMDVNVYKGLIERDRDWAFGSAKMEMVIPDIDTMESMKNKMLRLIPNINFHGDAFRSSSQPSQQRNHNSY